MLIGGGLTGWRSWEPHEARLSETRRVTRVQPVSVQYGLEDRPLPEGYSVGLESRALQAALADDEQARPLDLLGWSYGAVIALDFALSRPDRVRTLTLIEPPAFWVVGETGRLDADAARVLNNDRARYAGMTNEVTEEELEDFILQNGLGAHGKRPRELPNWPVLVQHRRSLRSLMAVMDHADTKDRLESFRRPVLLVKGTGSTRLLHLVIDGLSSTLPRAQVVELLGGHAPHLLSVEAFMDRLERFLETA